MTGRRSMPIWPVWPGTAHRRPLFYTETMRAPCRCWTCWTGRALPAGAGRWTEPFSPTGWSGIWRTFSPLRSTRRMGRAFCGCTTSCGRGSPRAPRNGRFGRSGRGRACWMCCPNVPACPSGAGANAGPSPSTLPGCGRSGGTGPWTGSATPWGMGST